MKHPESLLIPIMMFADYFLTVLAAIQREKRYSQHFKTEHYELNPLWQTHIASRRWFNPRHVLLTILVSATVICTLELGDRPDESVHGILGAVLVPAAMVLGRHLYNLLIFGRVVSRPAELSGQVVMSHEFVLYLSLCGIVAVLIPIWLVALFSRSSFARGGVIGILAVLIVHLVWIGRARKRKRTSNQRV